MRRWSTIRLTIVTGQVSGTSNYRTLDELQARLDPDVFWRVHRSHLVNINKIKEIVPWFSRNYILRMKDAKATEIPVSRSQTKPAAGVPEAVDRRATRATSTQPGRAAAFRPSSIRAVPRIAPAPRPIAGRQTTRRRR